MAESAKLSRDVNSPTQPVPMAAVGGAAAPQQQQPEIQIDDSQAMARYANFCRITGTPEELIVDFGLNPQPFGTPIAPIAVSQRVIINPYVAKRLAYALQLTIERYEAMFGVLETDVQRRVRYT